MISRRVLANLVAFALLFVALASWAVVNVVRLDIIERPYEIAVEFDRSPGLQPNVEATYLGVSIGSVDSVRLEAGHVRVVVDVNRGVELPEGLSAAVRRRSAVGEPYLALDPPDEPDAPTIDPGAGYTIPVARTSAPLSYGELFASVDALVSAIEPDALAVVLRETATALEGRGQQIRQILAGADAVTSTLAERGEVLDEMATDLTALTAALASQHEGIGSAFDDLAALTDTLAATSDELDQLLEEAPGFGKQVEELVTATYADLTCAFGDVGSIFTTIGSDARIEDLLAVLRSAARARTSLDSAMVPPGDAGADGWYLGGSFGVAASAPPAAYPSPPAEPAPPALVPCAASGPGPAAVPPLDDLAAPDAGRQAGPDGALDVPARVPVPAPELPDSTGADATDGPFPLALLLAAVLVALFLAAMAAARPWRWLPGGGGDDDDDD